MNVQNYLSSSFKQYADLDLAGNTTFTPIGSTTTPFTGTYDGSGRKISNWTYGDTTMSNVGLFGVVSGNTGISNLNIKDFNLTGGTRVGLLVGSSDANSQSVQISNCSSSGQVTSSGFNVGGLVGVINNTTIQNANSLATINSFAGGGGLVGGVGSNGSIENSYASGKIICTRTSTSYCGGLVGQSALAGTMLINNSYATGEVAASGSGAGGLVGYFYGGTISNSYASGVVEGTTQVGGLIGTINNSTGIGGTLINSSYSNGIASGTNSIGGLVGRNITAITITKSYFAGSVNVTSGDAAGGLLGYGLDLTLSSSYSLGSVTGGTTSRYLGGLVGFIGGNSSFTDSFAQGKVTGYSSYVGGLVGLAQTTPTFNRCYAIGAVTGTTQVGGLIGQCLSCGAIASSYWDITTSGQSTSAGGLGYNTNQMQTQSNYSGWDFTSIWNPPSPGVYPTLR